jgi:hypothetical protein
MLTCTPTCSENTKFYLKIKICTLKSKYGKYRFDVFHVLPSLLYTLSLNFKIPRANHLNNN